MENAEYFRTEMKAKSFDIPDDGDAIVPVMLYDAKLAKLLQKKMMENGVYVIVSSPSCSGKEKPELEFSFLRTYSNI